MSPETQEARSLKFEPRGSVTLRQLSTGNFAMYPLGGVGTPFWIGPADELLQAYANRPEPVKVSRPTPVARPVRGLDLGKINFNL